SAARAVSSWMPFHARGLANGMVTSAAVAAIASTYFVFGSLMDLVGWPAAFMLGGFASLLLTIVWSIYATDRPGEHPGVNAGERELIDLGRAVAEPETTTLKSRRLPDETIAANTVADNGVLPDSFLTMLFDRNMLLLMTSYAALSYFQYMLFY